MELLAAGRDADVFALDDDRVLRRYRDGRPAAPDADLLSAVVASGFPAPAVLGVEGADIASVRRGPRPAWAGRDRLDRRAFRACGARRRDDVALRTTSTMLASFVAAAGRTISTTWTKRSRCAAPTR